MENQEIIANAYGKFWEIVKDHIDENGWCTMIDSNNKFVTPTFLDLGMARKYVEDNIDSGYDSSLNIHSWRPKSLEGFKNNNGWTRINSIEDIPKEKVNCYFAGYNENTKEFYISELQERDNTRLQNLFESKYLTHIYIVNPTPKPKPPLYL